MIDRQHVWVGPEATRFEAPCEACLARRDEWSMATRLCVVEGTLRKEADVGFMTCRRGHRIIVRRIGRELVAPRWRAPLVELGDSRQPA
jgi:hypothetical protein